MEEEVWELAADPQTAAATRTAAPNREDSVGARLLRDVQHPQDFP